MIPWRVKNFVSEHFPLLYHLAANVQTSRASAAFWDYAFDVSWEAGSRDWPTKNRLIELITHPSAVILDLGCGTGATLRYLQERGYQNLEGLEISQRAVEVLGAHGIKMHKAKLPNVPTASSRYDFVIASQVLEHLIRRRKFLREVVRTLKPDGALIAFTPDNCLGPIDEPSHVIKFTEQRLRKELCEYFPDVYVESIKDVNFEMPVLFAYAQRTTGKCSIEHLAALVASAR